VAQVDALGNEVAGVPHVELQAPLATYTPWQLRLGYPSNPGELVDFLGTYIPLPRTEAERARRGDVRPSIVALYPTQEAYRQRVSAAAARLVGQGYLLAEDVPRVLSRAEAYWAWVMAQ
jgi:hypothetical protein